MRLRFRTRRGDRGVVLPLFALMLTTLILMVSFAVDLGRLRAERRDVQADADAIALDAVRAMAGMQTPEALTAAVTEANLSAARNDFPATLTVANVAVGMWDVANQELDPSGPTDYPDAVRVTLSSTIPMYFDLSSDERSVTRTGVAVARAQTKGALGSVFSGLQLYDPADGCAARADADAQMTFMNHLFTEYFDIQVSGGVGAGADTGTISCDVTGPADGLQLDALSYQGLAFSKVTLGQLAQQFGGASPEQLMASSVTAADLFNATADALDANGNVADSEAAADLRLIAASMDTEADGGAEVPGQPSRLPFGQIASGGTPADCADADDEPKPCAAEAELNVLQMLHAAALAMDGENFAAVDLPINVPFSNATITPKISIIESPQVDTGWKYAGQPGPHTAQVKIGVNIPLTGVQLNLGLLGIPGVAGVRAVNGNIPLLIEVARADALYERIICSPQADQSALVDMLVDTGAVSIGFGAVTDGALQGSADAGLTATSLLNGSISVGLPGIPPLVPSVSVDIDLASATNVSGRQTFKGGAVFNGGYDANVNLLGASESHTFEADDDAPYDSTPWYRYDGGLSGTSITDSAFGSLTFNALSSGTLGSLNAFGVTSAVVHNMIRSALAPVMSELGDEFVDNILSALGITLAGADGRIDGVRCQVPALANRGLTNEG